MLVDGQVLPMPMRADAAGPLRVFGLRYRSFVPRPGLHPALPAQTPLRLVLRHPDRDQEHGLTLHEWQPEGLAYDGLPADLDEAASRRAERLTQLLQARGASGPPRPATGPGLGECSLDLRYPAPGVDGHA